jgi:predicted phosphodiesterase
MTLKYLREFSDTHLNIHYANKVALWEPTPLETDKETVLILAGDIWESDKFMMHANKSWIKPIAERFLAVIMVAGNHDNWGENFHYYPTKIKEQIKKAKLDNVYFLDNDAVTIDNVKFLGGTLWTDFNKSDPFTVWQAKFHMNDYNYIRAGDGYRKLLADDILLAHRKTKDFIFNNLEKKDGEKIVVVTHHSPSFQSLSDEYRGNGYSNGYYHSEFGDLIVDSGIGLWVYGHTHCPMKYKIGETTLMNNAVGYYGHENTGYDPINLIDIDTI